MTCCQGYAFVAGGETTFDVDASRVKYGSGALAEAGWEAKQLGMTRVALVTDPSLAAGEFVDIVRRSLVAEGLDVAVYDESRVEPTDASFQAAAAFARDGRFDGFVSVGGGSSIDTAKAANLYATYPPDDFDAYVNAPIGRALAVPGPLRPHIACPTTCGTGAEVTGIAIFDYLAHHAKTGIASKRIKPTLGIVDPDVTRTLPATVVACSGFDVLSHALESYTAKPYTQRERSAPGARPMSQGANPFSDIASSEALRIIGANIVRAVGDAADTEARERMMFAAMLAGIGFGNAGVHVPHAMSYAVAGLVRAYRAPDYPAGEPIVPHGMAVILNAPATTRFLARANPARHLEAAALVGADTHGAAPDDAGELLAGRIEALMRATAMPNGIGGVGFMQADIPRLRDGAIPQKRLLANAPQTIAADDLDVLFADALSYW
jgi:alcohol dehydrogenase class IV